MSEMVLKTEKLDKVYKLSGRKVRALSDVNLQVKKGDFISIMGPSGSGKTTLLNMLGCLDKPTYGKVILDGVDVARVPEKRLFKIRKYKVGFVFQTFNLMPYLNSIENVELPMEGTKKSKDERRKKAIENGWTIRERRTQAASTERGRATKSRYCTCIGEQPCHSSG